MVMNGYEWLLMVETLELLAIQWLGGSDNRSVWGLHIPNKDSLFNEEPFGAT